MRNPSDRLTDLRAELEQYVPDRVIGPDHLGFAVPLQLHSAHGELHLMTNHHHLRYSCRRHHL